MSETLLVVGARVEGWVEVVVAGRGRGEGREKRRERRRMLAVGEIFLDDIGAHCQIHRKDYSLEAQLGIRDNIIMRGQMAFVIEAMPSVFDLVLHLRQIELLVAKIAAIWSVQWSLQCS